MDILKPGKEPQKWALEVVCSGYGHYDDGCEAVLRVHKEDLYQTEHPSNELFVGYYTSITFRCCSCGVETDLKHDDRPRDWPNLPTRKIWLEKTEKGEGK